ncbi:MAG: hypothetical protein RSC17_08570 [Lachnospiraceae bacterium]
MNRKNFVICDSEQSYAHHLMEMLSIKKEFTLQVRTCTTLESVLELEKNQIIDILLIEESYPKDQRHKINSIYTFVLTRGGNSDIAEDETGIYKYQSSDAIYIQILQACQNKKGELLQMLAKERRKVIGVYSPIHRIGKTTFALILGKELAKRGSVLYLNLEEYAGEGGHFPKEAKKTMEDLLYYAKQEEENLGFRMSGMVEQIEELDYIPPIKTAVDLKAVSSEEWRELLQQILEKSIYETIILDLSESVQGLLEILGICNVIYMPIRKDRFSQAKVRSYEMNLQVLHCEKLEEVTKKILLPREITDYVKELLKGEPV